jgi:hypothetical protein
MNRLACFVSAALWALSLASPLAAEPLTSPPPAAGPDFAALWAEARRALPELRDFSPVEAPAPALQALLAWVGPSGKATVYGRDCEPIPVTRDGDELVGSRVVRSSTKGNVRTVETDEVRFGDTRTVLGSTTTTYRRDESGKWVEDGVSACGCAEYPAGNLRQVRGDAAWYDGKVVTLTVHCGAAGTTTAPCREGEGERTCHRCSRLALDVLSVSQGWGSRSAGTTTASMKGGPPVDCTQPCPSDALGALIERLNQALEGRQFLQTVHPAERPALFRTKERCLRR